MVPESKVEDNSESPIVNGDNNGLNNSNKVEDSSSSVITPAETVNSQGSNGSDCDCKCKGMSQEPTKWVYAIGRVDVRFTHESVQREYQQALKGETTSNQTEGQVLYNTLKKNRYLARAALWVFQVEKLDAYILEPTDPYDYDLLVEAIKPTGDDEIDTDVVVGALGDFPPSSESGGITAPVVVFDQLYSFSRKELIGKIPKPKDMPESAFRSTSNELVDRIQLMTDNVGATDEHRDY